MKRCRHAFELLASAIPGYLFAGLLFAQSAHAQLREIENQIPKNAPLKIEFQNFDTENWVHDVEIKVTNTGKKPIYYLFLVMTLDVKADDGNVRGFPFVFGSGELYSSKEARQGDSFIAPNESFVFKNDENLVQAWNMRRARGNFLEPQKGFLSLGWINFGDGSGMKGGGTPFKKKISRPKS